MEPAASPTDDLALPPGRLERSRVLRLLLLAVGIALPQALLYGPSLAGDKVLLPLDYLASPAGYIPSPSDQMPTVPHDPIVSDLVLVGQPNRAFAAAEFRAGRVPLWDPADYAGAPFATYGKYSPFEWLYVAFPSPGTLAWMQLAVAAVAGAGAYVFLRRSLNLSAAAALAGAWSYPLTGYFVFWQGFSLTQVVAWLPWLFWATAAAVRRPAGWGGPALAPFTALALLGGHVDIAGQALLAAGAFAVWCLVESSVRPFRPRRLAGAAAALAAGWGIGLAAAAPYWMPLLEYAATGDRLARRQAGTEERPPVGAAALPQVVLPSFYGTTRAGSMIVAVPLVLPESAATAYAGLVATLLFAPLAWCHARQRPRAWFFLCLALFALGWQLDLPGVVALLRAPGLNAFSHNRLTFVAAFALVVLAALGLDALRAAVPPRRRWFLLPVGLLALFAGACADRYWQTADELAIEVEARIDPTPAARDGRPAPPKPPSRLAVRQANHLKPDYDLTHLWGFSLASLGLAGWALLAFSGGRPLPAWAALALGAASVGEMTVTAWGANPQCDPALYYPRLPLLEWLSEAPPGRVLGVACLPPDLGRAQGLRDVRGYDGVDPRRLVEALDLGRNEKVDRGPNYAALQHYIPSIRRGTEGRYAVSPVLDMLEVRYLLFRGNRPKDVRAAIDDGEYWVVENPSALPRAFVPRRMEAMPPGRPTLDRLGAADFDPRRVAYVDRPLPLPADCSGRGAVTAEWPTGIEVTAEMDTPGLLVLADQWYEGWTATVDGRPVPVERVNHVLRGIELPAGRSAVRFAYEPPGLRRGLAALALGCVAWTGWLCAESLRRAAAAQRLRREVRRI